MLKTAKTRLAGLRLSGDAEANLTTFLRDVLCVRILSPALTDVLRVRPATTVDQNAKEADNRVIPIGGGG
jgi:hypothetical protein